MRVHDSNLNAVTIGTRQSTRTDSVQINRQGAYSSGYGGTQDRVSLSDLSSILAQSGDDNSARSARVDQLRASYQSGGYHVQAAAVAAKVVDSTIQAA